jgi:hypothetical protein
MRALAVRAERWGSQFGRWDELGITGLLADLPWSARALLARGRESRQRSEDTSS